MNLLLRTFLCPLLLPFAQSWAQGSNPSATTNIPPWDTAREASVWKGLNPRPTLGCRDIMGTILEATGTPGYEMRGEKIEKALEQLESMQDLDPSSKTYGNFRWYSRETKPGDRNAVEFVTQRSIILKLLYSDRLSTKANETLDRILKHSVEGIHLQKVNIDYTNIFLMKTWNILALGQALKDPALSKEGAQMLDAWIDFTRKNGITEFLSPTYLGVDLDCLGLIANQITDPAISGKAKGALLFFWQNIAANWFEPSQRLGGAHGRDYDYLTGHGELDHHLREGGWITSAQPKNAPQTPVFDAATRWLPPEELHRQALSEIPRFVTARCGTNDFNWTAQQVGRHISIGVTGSGKGAEDKPFRVNLEGSGGPKTVIVNFLMDGRDDPYGKKKIPTGSSGHMKAHHLNPVFRAVQSGSDVLFLSSYPGLKPISQEETNNACLYSHLDLPEEAVVWSVDQPLDPKLPTQPIPGNICFLRLGDTAVGIRFLLAEDIAGKPVTAELVTDGHEYNAKRLSVTHSATPPGEKGGAVAMAVRTEEGLDEAGFAAFRKKFADAHASADHQGSIVRLSSEGSKNLLVLEADTTTGKILRSEGGDPAIQIAPLTINGKKVDLVIP